MNKLGISVRDQDSVIDQKPQMFNPPVEKPPKVSQSKSQILVLDGVRAVACLGVLSYHLNFLARNYGIWQPLHGINTLVATLAYLGESGVILFFLLSSFLLFLPYAKSLLFDSPWPSFRRFYLRRIFRIVPGYLVALFLISLFFHPEFFHRHEWHNLWLFLTFRMDYNLSQRLDGPFWTLAVEFQFYLLLPIIAWFFGLIVRRGPVRWRMFKLTWCLFFMTAWGLLTRYWGQQIADTPKLDFLIPHSVSLALKSYIYGDTGKFFEVFAIGMFICMIYIYTQNAPLGVSWKIKIGRLSPLLLMAGLALTFFLGLWHLYVICVDPYHYTKYYPVFTFLDPYISIIMPAWLQWQAIGHATSYGLCLCALLYGSPKLKQPMEWPLLRWVGSISFSLYMWHLPFIFLFLNDIVHNIQQQGWNHAVQYAAFWCWTLVVIFPISAMLYRWVEQPGIRLGERLIRKLEQE
jgi:peptidoglycan/LPS O-acetylase OafA/YrhL